MSNRRFLACVGAAALVLLGCSEEQPGSAAVYDRIAGLDDCAALQQEFDTASASRDRAEPGSEQAEAALSYMEAANDRLQELGC